ncbi:uncharacterized protein LOC121984852 [Zingiber officinale]|uniref:Formin-like protein 18 n=1 Tax=Zingiber officinale TaxID=94328 RepID=A0A8J5L1I2_ZINOF|nr:uncharacterized protein LOC121984852 [Zingiber officinale]KAG6503919.1 hypothetical protein ZIOFF_036243 [Zingiber officinale]
MDPCPFVRVLVGNLALRIPFAAPPAGGGVHNSSFPCFAKIRLDKSPHQNAAVPLVTPEDLSAAAPSPSLSARFNLSQVDLDRISGKSSVFAAARGRARLKVAVYTGRQGATCGVTSGRLLGEITVTLDLKGVIAEGGGGRAVVFHSGWVELGAKKKKKVSSSLPQLYLTVRAEPDPRFVFEFDGEPECSPQVFQVQGQMRQPVFTCKFCCRSAGDRNLSLSSMHHEPGSSRNWLSSFGSERERTGKERKGWSVTVHDLSGSPVALASMVTPFVASTGTDRVSRSNPGAWLVLRPGDGTWKPWGRLEAWRERDGGLGYRFELLADAAMGAGINLAESTLSSAKGGTFTIDLTGAAGSPLSRSLSRSTSPGCSPRGSGDFGYSLWPFSSYRGFVMSSTVAGEGRSGRPTVEVGVQHVGCSEDAAAFVALAAAVDLSVDACRLFSHKLRKELIAPDSLR